MTNKIKLFFKDMHNDGMDKVVEVTEQEWQELIRPAIENDYPIDGATVDSDMLDKLYAYPSISIDLTELNDEYIIAMV